MRVGIEASVEPVLLAGFRGLDLVRIPAEPDGDIAVDFWVAAQAPAWLALADVIQAMRGVSQQRPRSLAPPRLRHSGPPRKQQRSATWM